MTFGNYYENSESFVFQLHSTDLDRKYLNEQEVFELMVLKYPIFDIKINKKFARTPKVTWEQQRKLIFDIATDLSKNNLFAKEHKNNPNYNLTPFTPYFSETDKSLGIMPLNAAGKIVDINLLNDSETAILQGEVTETNCISKPFVILFKMGLIEHTDITIFKEGKEEKIWSTLSGEDAGQLHKTTFGIIVSERLHRILLIKQWHNESVNAWALLDYLNKKSPSFSANEASNVFKILPFIQNLEFDIDDVDSVYSLEVGINNDLINEYKTRQGRSDAFRNLILVPMHRLFGTGRSTNFEITFSEEGDADAKELFEQLYGSFSEVYGEELEKIFERFKVEYESRSKNKCIEVNFKRNLKYYYEPTRESDTFSQILDAFNWLCEQLNHPTGENRR